MVDNSYREHIPPYTCCLCGQVYEKGEQVIAGAKGYICVDCADLVSGLRQVMQQQEAVIKTATR